MKLFQKKEKVVKEKPEKQTSGKAGRIFTTVGKYVTAVLVLVVGGAASVFGYLFVHYDNTSLSSGYSTEERMEKNQFADFDLYKDGKAFDTDVYTVKYVSSDEDVVWVDAKNGKLRADQPYRSRA